MDNLEFIVMTTSFGGRDISHIKAAVPNLHVCVDYNHDPMGNFLNSLTMTENPAIHMEDDIELCNNFYDKVVAAVNQYPDTIINFFSLRKKDYELQRPYYETGSKYLMNQCFYLPAGYGPRIADYYNEWEGKIENPTGLDSIIADWMKKNKMRYIQWFPHLVNHAETKSLINPRRSGKRTDKNFKK